jgi:hypothetical protein
MSTAPAIEIIKQGESKLIRTNLDVATTARYAYVAAVLQAKDPRDPHSLRKSFHGQSEGRAAGSKLIYRSAARGA